MKYYYPEHITGYQQILSEGRTAWGEIHGVAGFENFSARACFEEVIPGLRFAAGAPSALVLGCGTGPDACYLAERGFRVTGFDLIPEAIQLARQIASQRGLDIRYEVQDVCHLAPSGATYDIVVDSYCLQCIVFDEERQALFAAVRGRLALGGHYLVNTAILDAEHEAQIQPDQTVTDAATGTVYTGYSGDLIDLATGIALQSLAEDWRQFPEARQIAGRWYLPYRRHLRAESLYHELTQAGFGIVRQASHHAGSVVCVRNDAL